jgi:hypothetical protein
MMALHRRRVVQQVLQRGLFLAQFGQFLLDLDGFQARQLAQADFQDVFGLAVERA